MNAKPDGEKKLPRLRLRVTAAAESILRSGHPWLFAQSIRHQNREGRLGELAVVYDRKDRFLAVGLFDPDSPIPLRVLNAGEPQTIDMAWWLARLREAVERRQGLSDAQTTGLRLINGESDRWPGLVLDRYGSTLVLKLYTAAWLPWLDEIGRLMLEELLRSASLPAISPAQEAVREDASDPNRLAGPTPGAGRIVLRLSRNIQQVAKEQFARTDGQVLSGPPLEGPVVFLENGLRFEAEVLRGQKTGFFLDQRDNRQRVENLARGRNVLNAFSFSGGFSLYAARGGALSVTDLDLSAHALESARRNFALNQSDPVVASCRHELIQADAFEWLSGNPQRTFDLAVLDPPSLARRESERAGAIHAYGKLAATGIAHLNQGGILVACSCSAHVSAEEFFQAVRGAVTRSGRKFEELQVTRHAPDHPAGFKEAEYLKAIYLQLD